MGYLGQWIIFGTTCLFFIIISSFFLIKAYKKDKMLKNNKISKIKKENIKMKSPPGLIILEIILIISLCINFMNSMAMFDDGSFIYGSLIFAFFLLNTIVLAKISKREKNAPKYCLIYLWGVTFFNIILILYCFFYNFPLGNLAYKAMGTILLAIIFTYYFNKKKVTSFFNIR